MRDSGRKKNWHNVLIFNMYMICFMETKRLTELRKEIKISISTYIAKQKLVIYLYDSFYWHFDRKLK